MPHLALPTLTAHLRAQGVDVVQRDLNLEIFDTLLTPGYLEMSAERLAAGPLPEGLRQRWEARAPELIAHVETAKATMRDARFYDGRTSLHAFLTLVQSLELASLPYHPNAFQFTAFHPGVSVDSSKDLVWAARNPQANPFYDLFRAGIVQDIQRECPDIVGISIPTLDQMLAAMTLAYLIKDTGIPSHVVIGGPHVSMLREQLPRVPKLFDLFDSAALFDGEGTLLRLAEELEAGGDLSKVPNLIYRKDGAVRVTDTPPIEVPTLSGAPDLLPDFDGLPLDRYLAPDLVLPLLSSHGCYHGTCGFCNVGYGGPRGFRKLDPELVVDQMLALRTKYGARHFFFADEALTPRTLRVLSDRLGNGRSPGVPDDLPMVWLRPA